MSNVASAQYVQPQHSRLKRWSHLLGRFLAGQLLVQAVNVASGFLLIRWLAKEQWAQFNVAFAFQTTINMLVDVGFSNSIIALVGERVANRSVVGGFLRSAAHYRNRMFVVIGVVAAFAFPLVTYRQHWGFGVKAWLFAAIISSVLLQRQIMYGAPLLINRRLTPYYSAQVASGFVRLILAFVLLKLGLLNAIATAWLTTVAIGITGLIYRLQARPYIEEPRHADPVFNREMIRLIKPLIPGIVFTAFQAQIAVGIITLFGRTQNIAEVSALSRLSALFAVFTAFNTAIVEPHVARLPWVLVPRRYVQIGIGAFVGTSMIGAAAFVMPGPLLFLLGHNYRDLGSDVGWVVSGACVSYVATVFWVMNGARKFLYWWYTGAYIATVLLSQIVCVFFLDLSSTRNVLYFILITNAATLLVHIAAGAYGIGRRQIVPAAEELPEIALSQAPNQ